ncbi:M20/M25/M40 family metallo-hydrolase [Leifsonia sp. YIM 134122]|uniref:M20/M25/M40 family metallo-hydrolase n=1 Tax=Leifsonia stereocauli TaxID=3134136 RepID=A0ABU9W7P6_9MICO
MGDDELIDLVRELVAIPSVNPSLGGGGAGEAAVARFAAGWLAARGFEVWLIGRDASRPSVLAVAAGSGGGRTLLVNGHLDTVGVDGFTGDPFDARIAEGRMLGRGVYDMKSGAAAAMIAASRASGSGLRGDVVLTLVADEEFASVGTEDSLLAIAERGIRADGAIVVEPTGSRLTVAHRGFAWFTLAITGVPAHGSQPELGVDAISHATDVLLALRSLDAELAARAAHPMLPRSTVRVATIVAGSDAATVAAHARLTIERRTLPGETPAAVRREIEAALASVAAADGIRWDLTELVSRGAFETPTDAPIQRVVSDAVLQATGTAVELQGDPWWTDAGLLAEAGIPTVLFGVDGGGAHAPDEWLDLASVQRLAAVLERSIADFCS